MLVKAPGYGALKAQRANAKNPNWHSEAHWKMSEKIRSMQTGTASELQRTLSSQIFPLESFGGWIGNLRVGAAQGLFARELVIGRQ